MKFYIYDPDSEAYARKKKDENGKPLMTYNKMMARVFKSYASAKMVADEYGFGVEDEHGDTYED